MHEAVLRHEALGYGPVSGFIPALIAELLLGSGPAPCKRGTSWLSTASSLKAAPAEAG